jgi:two-component system, cell cycle sensor histidine kinase and response regulator CckA
LSSDERLHFFLNDAPIPCHEIDANGEIVFVNNAECELLGLARDELLGRPIWEFVAPEERSSSREAVARKIHGEQPLARFERRYIRPDGIQLVLEIYEKHIRDDESHIIGMRSFLIDVTQRNRSEQALGESEKLYRHLVEHASDIIYRTDVHGRFQVFNPVASQLFACSAEDLIGRSYLDLVRPDFRVQVRRFYRQQFAGRLSHTYLEFPAVTMDGREIWFGQNVEIVEEDGRIVGFQAITRDITAQRRAEEGLRYVRDELERRVKERTGELEHANALLRTEMTERQRQEDVRRNLESQVQHRQRLESLGLLAGGIAHDFNNLLAVILGYADLALPEVPETSRARTSIEKVISAAKSAADLTSQMLAYSGRGKFAIESVNLTELIEHATRLITSLISKKALLELNLAPDPIVVEGDPAQLRQVMINLITNASDAIGDRSGVIRVTTGTEEIKETDQRASVLPEVQLPPGRYVFVEVADTGCGMDEATLDRIFDPFFTTKFTGRGLGLAAVQGIVRGHQGTLQVKSEPGRGTSFRVLFPAGKQRAARSATPERELEDDWHPAGVVLVVDDEPAVRALACEVLGRHTMLCLTAIDGYDAMRQFEAHANEITAVLLDLTMPGLDGSEVLARLREMKPNVKVILSSGFDANDVSAGLGGNRPSGFLRKPYSPAELIRAFRGIM